MKLLEESCRLMERLLTICATQDGSDSSELADMPGKENETALTASADDQRSY
ncbi:hypothetical protein D3C80_1998190 [compost metagenome]